MKHSRHSGTSFGTLRPHGSRRLLLTGIAILGLAFSFVSQEPIRPSLAATSQSPDFQDTFDSTAIDSSKWGLDYPWDEGNVYTCRRSELQCYEPEQATESNGMLR